MTEGIRGYWAIVTSIVLHGGVWWAIQALPTPAEPPRAIAVELRSVRMPVRPKAQAAAPPRRAAKPLRTASAHHAAPRRSHSLPQRSDTGSLAATASLEPIEKSDAESSFPAVSEFPVAAEAPGTVRATASYEAYLAAILAMLEGKVEYPLQARRMQWAGRSLLHCTVARDGDIQSVVVEGSSGHRLLDTAAVRAVERIGRFPPVPDEIAGDTVVLSIPVTFQLEE